MKRLNKTGIQKVVDYIGEDRCRHTSFVGHGDLLFGALSIDEIKKLDGINVKLENVGGGLHRVFLEDDGVEVSRKSNTSAEVEGDQERIVEPKRTERPEDREVSKDPRDLKNLAIELAPILQEIFPTKDDVNQALETMKGQMIDPEEMMDNLRVQMKSLKKQSREMDKVG